MFMANSWHINHHAGGVAGRQCTCATSGAFRAATLPHARVAKNTTLESPANVCIALLNAYGYDRSE